MSRVVETKSIVLTTREAAELLRLHPVTIRNLIRTNQLAALRVGTKFLVVRESLERLLRVG